MVIMVILGAKLARIDVAQAGHYSDDDDDDGDDDDDMMMMMTMVRNV